MTNPDSAPPAAAPSDADPAAWIEARLASLGAEGARVHAAPLAAGPDGRIVLSTDPAASAVAPARPLLRASGAGTSGGPGAVLAVRAIRVAPGESLVVTSPDGSPVRVVAGALEVADGGRVVLETGVELHAARASFGAESPIVAVGADGGPGGPGRDGTSGSGGRDVGDGEDGQPGGPGGDGKPGPSGTHFFAHLSGTLTIVAGGGNGGTGGPGGRGGNGRTGGRGVGGNGGNGGRGGPGGKAADGPTIVVTFDVLEPGASIQQVIVPARPGNGGRGGGGGNPGQGDRYRRPGNPGGEGPAGAAGEPPVIIVRPRA